MKQKFAVAINAVLEQVRNHILRVTIMSLSPEVDPWHLRMTPLTSDFCEVNDNCVKGAFQKGNPPQGIPSPYDQDEQSNSTNRITLSMQSRI